jgi:hypothetical protein
MPIPPIVPLEKQNLLLTVTKPKFDAYFSITSNWERSVKLSNGFYRYPDPTMIADIVFLWAVFTEVFEIVGKQVKFAKIVKGDAFLKQNIRRIIEGDSSSKPDGSFWRRKGSGLLEPVPLDMAVDTESELEQVLRTLRNSFAHSNWLYENLSALDYWKKRGWQTAGAPPAFKFESRPATNYMTYIADASDWKP